MLGSYFSGFSIGVNNVPIGQGTQHVELVKVCWDINPKSGIWPHFGVSIPFFDSEVRGLHKGLKVSKLGSIHLSSHKKQNVLFLVASYFKGTTPFCVSIMERFLKNCIKITSIK